MVDQVVESLQLQERGKSYIEAYQQVAEQNPKMGTFLRPWEHRIGEGIPTTSRLLIMPAEEPYILRMARQGSQRVDTYLVTSSTTQDGVPVPVIAHISRLDEMGSTPDMISLDKVQKIPVVAVSRLLGNIPESANMGCLADYGLASETIQTSKGEVTVIKATRTTSEDVGVMTSRIETSSMETVHDGFNTRKLASTVQRNALTAEQLLVDWSSNNASAPEQNLVPATQPSRLTLRQIPAASKFKVNAWLN